MLGALLGLEKSSKAKWNVHTKLKDICVLYYKDSSLELPVLHPIFLPLELRLKGLKSHKFYVLTLQIRGRIMGLARWISPLKPIFF